MSNLLTCRQPHKLARICAAILCIIQPNQAHLLFSQHMCLAAGICEGKNGTHSFLQEQSCLFQMQHHEGRNWGLSQWSFTRTRDFIYFTYIVYIQNVHAECRQKLLVVTTAMCTGRHAQHSSYIIRKKGLCLTTTIIKRDA